MDSIEKMFKNIMDEIDSILSDDGFEFLESLRSCEQEVLNNYRRTKERSDLIEFQVIRKVMERLQEITERKKRRHSSDVDKITMRCTYRLEHYISRNISKNYQQFLLLKLTHGADYQMKYKGYAGAIKKLLKIYQSMRRALFLSDSQCRRSS